MPAYSSFGGLDDQILTDGDRAFIGMELRKQPNQLQPGELTMSKNGRIDGYWQPRKGANLVSGALALTTNPLILPFFVVDASPGIVPIVVTRTSNVVTMVFDLPGHGIGSIGETGYLTLGDVGSPSNPPFTGTDDIPAGAYEVTIDSATNITFNLDGADEVLFGIDAVTGYVTSTIDNGSVNEILGSCTLSDPSLNIFESIVVATNSSAKRVQLNNYVVSNVPYPTGASLTQKVEMMQTFDRIYLFRDGQQPWEWVFNGRPIATSSYTSTTGEVDIAVKNHGFTVGDAVEISGIGYVTNDPNGSHTITAVTDDTFTYEIATGGGDETYTPNTGISKSVGFTKVWGGAYTQPEGFSITANEITVVDGLLTADVTGQNNTILPGDFVTVHFTEIPELFQLQGNRYEVVDSDLNNIKFYVPAGNFTGNNSDKFDFSGRVSNGAGFIHMPAPPWATYFQRRLWCPFYYQPGGTASSPTYDSRNIRDEIVVSDILDGNTFDQIYSQFVITGGVSDYIMGMHPFYDDALMVFMRNSIHLISGTQGTLSDTVTKELTREVGCLARKTIVGYGNLVFFLSDNGVYGVQFLDQYNLRGTEEPLSKPIQPLIDRLNKSLAFDSVAVYFNNRYYIAVPLDSEVGADDATGNNAVLVYNVLNKAWESIDTYAGGFLNVLNFHINQEEERNSLFAVNDQGGVHILEQNASPEDLISLDPIGGSESFPIDYEMRTRGYDLGAFERKKFHRSQVQVQSDYESSDALILFKTEDPDQDSYEIGTISNAIGTLLPSNETANLRYRLGNPRGLYGILTFKANLSGSGAVGRPKVNSIAIDGTLSNRQTISQY